MVSADPFAIIYATFIVDGSNALFSVPVNNVEALRFEPIMEAGKRAISRTPVDSCDAFKLVSCAPFATIACTVIVFGRRALFSVPVIKVDAFKFEPIIDDGSRAISSTPNVI